MTTMERHECMARNYRLAMRDFVSEHRSDQWNHFPTEFAESILDSDRWPSFRRNGLAAGMSVNRENVDYSGILSVQQQKRLTTAWQSLLMRVDPAFARDMADGVIGNPKTIDVDGVEIDHADLRLIYNAWQIQSLANLNSAPVIVEIGGGYGGLAAKLKRLFPAATILIFDLPESNAIQWWYLSECFPTAHMEGYDAVMTKGLPYVLAAKPDFALLPGWRFSELPQGSVDLVINTRSMMEMSSEVISFYFDGIKRAIKTGGLFYCVNRYDKTVNGKSIRIKDYPFDDRWLAVHSGPTWDQPWIHELATVRLDRDNSFPLTQNLRHLPPYTLRDIGGQICILARTLAVIVLGSHPSVNPGLRGYIRNAWQRKIRSLAAYARARPALYGVLNGIRRRLLRSVSPGRTEQ